MGEIGRDRAEFLYEMTRTEILLIVRGYRRRNILQYQLQRLQAYGAFFSMRGTTKSPHDWLKLYFDDYRYRRGQRISQEDVDELQALMKAIRNENGQ